MIKYSKHPEKYDLNVRYKKLSSLVRETIIALRGDFKVVGKENLPNEVCCLMANHMGAFDPLVLMSIIDSPTCFVAKKEVKKMPFIGKCVKTMQGDFIDRNDLKQSLKVMLSLEEDLRNRNKNWIIFPEGTRNKDRHANLREFHHGTFRAPYRAEVPIVPCCVFGSWRPQKTKPEFKKYPLYIEFGKPIYPEEYKDMSTKELAAFVQSKVQQMITYHARKFDYEYNKRVNPSKYIPSSNN